MTDISAQGSKCKECGIELKDANSQFNGICLSCYEDEYFDEDPAPDYWLCKSCGYNCSPKTHERIGHECPKCTAIMEEQYY